MTWFNWIVLVYLTPAALLFLRYLEIASRAKAVFLSKGVAFSMRGFIPSMIRDSFLWPWYVIWHGLKQFIEDLK